MKAHVVSKEGAPPRREIESRVIGDIIMRSLKRFDSVAYIRFASVYQSFQDLGEFQKALLDLKKKKKQKVTAH